MLKTMYSSFGGTVFAHCMTLISSVWAIFTVLSDDKVGYHKVSVLGAFELMFINAAVGIVRYGNMNFGYKLKRVHMLTLNISAIISFAIICIELLYVYNVSYLKLLCITGSLVSLISNILEEDYKHYNKYSDVFVAINVIIVIYVGAINENFNAIALCLSYLFSYFIVGQSGFFWDTEMPSIDMLQYMQVFIIFFMIMTLTDL